MNEANAIEVDNITKTYRVKVRKDKEERSVRKYKTTVNKVIDGMSLEIKKGDVLGVIGRNGSGKSTLLCLLAKIMEPDTGTIRRSGKIASILELGMGFHADMTGRENIYLKGELYGFSKKEINKKIDKIIEYSGIEKYIDNPVRTYSSGMTGRLAFAIMVNVDSDIMLVDEVLSVGDAVFASKAKNHFKQLSESGKTVVFVSHQLEAVERMCNRAIWIENGKIKRDGPSKDVCSEYRNMLNESPEILMELAQSGVVESQYKLATMYRDGISIEKNDELYIEWVKRAAIQGHVRAQVEYGDYLLSIGDKSGAISNYQSAADNWDYEARMKLSTINTNGDDEISLLINIYDQLSSLGNAEYMYKYAVLLLKTRWDNESRSKAFQMALQSANKGYLEGTYQVAMMYKDGIGVERNIEKMKDYLVEAANRDHMPSIGALIELYSSGKIIQKDEKELFRWVQKASVLGNSAFMYSLASFYRDGVGTEKDGEESEKWFFNYIQSGFYWHKMWAIPYLKTKVIRTTKTLSDYYDDMIELNNDYHAVLLSLRHNLVNNKSVDREISKLHLIAESGNLDAIRQLGDMYRDGIAVEKDDSEALKWYEKGALLGDDKCLFKAGEAYRDGIGITEDKEKALKLFIDSANQGNILSIRNVIMMTVEDNKDVCMDAVNKMIFVAESGDVEAIKQIGDMYRDGIAVEKDDSEALKWYEKGALLGDARCREMVRIMEKK